MVVKCSVCGCSRTQVGGGGAGMHWKGGRGGLRGRGGWLGRPSSQSPPMVPAEGGPENAKLKSSWRRSKILAVCLKLWKRRRGGSGGGGLSSSCGVRPF